MTTNKDVQYNTDATFGWQYNRNARFKGGQYNRNARFGWQDNVNATFEGGMMIKNAVFGSPETPLSRAIKRFGESRACRDCTLQAFYEWVLNDENDKEEETLAEHDAHCAFCQYSKGKEDYRQ